MSNQPVTLVTLRLPILNAKKVTYVSFVFNGLQQWLPKLPCFLKERGNRKKTENLYKVMRQNRVTRVTGGLSRSAQRVLRLPFEGNQQVTEGNQGNHKQSRTALSAGLPAKGRADDER